MSDVLARLVAGEELLPEQMHRLVREIMSGQAGGSETAAVLVALHMKGETAGEIAAAAGVLREQMVRLATGPVDVLDTSGTGGDAAGTFNISTAAALVAAGAGVPVVKHGNRAVSSRSGSADVLAALGVRIEGDAEWSRRCFTETGFAFCFAPCFHPAMSHVAPVRRQLRIRTLFNCLGPLANPAGAAFQLVGVGRPELLDPLAGALARLGTRHAILVCGGDGLDEVSLSGPTQVRDVRGSTIIARVWQPEDFGLERCTLEGLTVSGPEESATVIRTVLDGSADPAARIVWANAAAALLAADRVTNLSEGVDTAREAITSGRASRVLDRIVACSREP